MDAKSKTVWSELVVFVFNFEKRQYYNNNFTIYSATERPKRYAFVALSDNARILD